MNRKFPRVFIIITSLLIIIGVVFYWNKKNVSENQNKQTKQGLHKSIVVSDGSITFTFEVPEKWLVETRNSGEKDMSTEEMRDFLATNYGGDIRIHPELTSDYADLPWKILKEMSENEMRKMFEEKKGEHNYDIGFPNASISSGNSISYTDWNAYQIDFYITTVDKSQREIKSIMDDEFYESNPHLKPSYNRESIGELFSARVIKFPLEIMDEKGNRKVTKGGTGGKRYYIHIEDSEKVLIIRKQAERNVEYEKSFSHLISTLKIKKEAVEEAEEMNYSEINTSKWTTYTNEGWDYSIKYPPDFFMKENPQGDRYPGDESTPFDGGQTLIVSDIEKMGIQDTMPDEAIHIVITTFKKKHSEQSLQEYLKELTRRHENTTNISEVVVNKKYGFEINKDNKRYVSIFLDNGEFVYHLYGENLNESKLTANYHLIREIFNTFQFI